MAAFAANNLRLHLAVYHLHDILTGMLARMLNWGKEMCPLPEDIDLITLRRRMDTHIIGNTLMRYERVASTNDVARERARTGHPEGLVVLAEEQSAGRGRLGRNWISAYGDALLVSILLRPTWLPPGDAFALTMMAGVALCRAVEQVAPVRARLKWPNDLLLFVDGEWRKSAGILTEVSVASDTVEWAIIGMGVNVNQSPVGTVNGRDLQRTATCVSAAAGQRISRAALLEALLVAIDEHYASLQSGERGILFTAWRSRLARIGEPVTVTLHNGELRGIAEDVAPDGTLLLRDADGILHQVYTGDVGF
ncbi:biotin--[acetyl-CoA-carboxylase] ligase [Roseiflexus sp.]|uniref:biotin--[acetyl-CoA-carboxylase] ligase n=1 Tax=Roseiflexus sp. TaxID=2562120 RepID=UPI00398B0E86